MDAQTDKFFSEASVHSAIVAYMLEHLYAARRLIDLSVEETHDDSLYTATDELDKVADSLRRLIVSS